MKLNYKLIQSFAIGCASGLAGLAIAAMPGLTQNSRLQAIGVTSNNDVVSIDLESIQLGDRRSGGGYWFDLYQVNSPSTIRSSNGVAGYVMTWWTDCNGASMEIFTSLDRNWRVISEDTESGVYDVPPRGSIIDEALDLVCE